MPELQPSVPHHHLAGHCVQDRADRFGHRPVALRFSLQQAIEQLAVRAVAQPRSVSDLGAALLKNHQFGLDPFRHNSGSQECGIPGQMLVDSGKSLRQLGRAHNPHEPGAPA